jgi:hypothetical protein
VREGWLEDEYLILFEESEAVAIADGYGVPVALPGFELIGLRGWDDFLFEMRTAIFSACLRFRWTRIVSPLSDAPRQSKP